MFPIELRNLTSEAEPLRVLLLEDDDHLRVTLSQVLQRQGFAVEAVAGSAEAIRLSQDCVFDLVITDIRMEGLDGLQALEAVQSSQPDIRSLVVTGFSNEDDSLRALRLGVREFLRKPFEIATFRQATEKLASAVRSERRRQSKLDAFHEVLLWALHGRASADGLVEAASVGEVTFRLARALNFSGASARSLQLASLCGWLESRAPGGLPAALAESLPEPVLEHLRQQPESLPARICRAARSRAENLETEPDEEMAAALQRLDTQDSEPSRKLQSLFSMAVTLEESGDLAAAEAAFSRLSQAQESSQSARAWLGLARLAARRGQLQPCEQAALQAIQAARAWGPLTYSTVSVEAGLLLSQAGSSLAQEVLRKTGELLQRLGFQQKACQARLALCLETREAPWENAFAQLKASSNPTQFQECIHWLVPLLQRYLVRGQDEKARELLQQLQPERQSQPEAVSAPALRAKTLGTLQFFFGEEPVSSEVLKKNRKAGLLLVCLMLQRDRYQNEETLAEDFWPEENLRGKANLTAVCSILRRHWKPAHWPGRDWEFVQRGPLGIRMNQELQFRCDYCALEDELNQAERGSPEEALVHYRNAFELQQGPFLDFCYMNWAELARARIETRCQEAFARYARLANQRQLHSEALEVSRRLIEGDRCQAEAHQLAMEALLGLQRAPEAVRLYEKYAQVLHKELGMEPPLVLFELYHRCRLV